MMTNMDLNTWMPLAELLAAVLGRGFFLSVVALVGLLAMRALRASAATQNFFLRLTTVALLALPALWFVSPVWQGASEKEALLLGVLQPAGDRPVFIDAPVDQFTVASTLEAQLAPSETSSPVWVFPLLLVWGAGFSIVSLRLIVGLWRTDLLHRKCSFVTASDWQESLLAIRDEMEIKSVVSIKTSDGVKVPFVMGFFRHTLCLPESVIASANPSERAIILRHELAHVARRDSLSRVLSQLALALHSLNPVVWLLTKLARVTEECVIDDTVVQKGIQAVTYAELLTRFATRGFDSLTCPAMAQASTIGKRVQRILDPSLNRRAPGKVARGIQVFTICAAALALTNVWAQEENQATVSDTADQSEPEWITVPFQVDNEKWLSAVTIDGKELTAQEFLKASGIELNLNDGGAAMYVPVHSCVNVRMKSADYSKFYDVLSRFEREDKSLKVFLEVKHVLMPKSADFPFKDDSPVERGSFRRVFTADQFKVILSELKKQNTTRVFAAPSYVSSSSERVTVEIPDLADIPVCDIDSVLDEDGVTIELEVSFREPGEGNASTAATIWSGQTIAFELEPHLLERHLVFLTATLIRPSGDKVHYTPSPTPATPVALNIKTIILDAGHGGRDSGSKGNALIEKDYNLDLARRVRVELEENDFEVVMTRTKDEYLTLTRRTEIGNGTHNAAFISLHANAHAKPEERGFETWYPKARSEKDPEGNRRTLSRQFAEYVQKELAKELGDLSLDRGIREANYRVLRDTTHPAVLIETGFLTNVEDENLLKLEPHRNRIAKAISAAVAAFATPAE